MKRDTEFFGKWFHIKQLLLAGYCLYFIVWQINLFFNLYSLEGISFSFLNLCDLGIFLLLLFQVLLLLLIVFLKPIYEYVRKKVRESQKKQGDIPTSGNNRLYFVDKELIKFAKNYMAKMSEK